MKDDVKGDVRDESLETLLIKALSHENVRDEGCML